MAVVTAGGIAPPADHHYNGCGSAAEIFGEAHTELAGVVVENLQHIVAGVQARVVVAFVEEFGSINVQTPIDTLGHEGAIQLGKVEAIEAGEEPRTRARLALPQ